MTRRLPWIVPVVLGMAAAVALVHTHAASGAVLCARTPRDGKLSSSLRIRDVCRKGEVQVDPAALGFCCAETTTTVTVPTTVTVTSTSVCPIYTTTTLGIPDCGGTVCFGFCPNARACVADGGGLCACTGPEVSCQVVSVAGTCGGTCPVGLSCQTVRPVGEDGCPGPPVCGCAP